MNVYFNAAILILQLVLLLSLVSSVPRRLQKKNKGGNTRFIGKRQLIAMEALQSGPGVFHKKLKTHVQPLEESCQSASFKNEFNSIRQQVKCEPRDTVVDLVPPLGAIIIPNAVIVKRCGGMCNGFKGCLPLQTQEKKMYVKTVRNSEILCTSITVVEDLKCRCNCLQTPKDCTPFQVYSKETCSCNCQNKDYAACIDSKNENVFWDESTCSCICEQNKTCTTGTRWEESECRCVKIRS
ncbi:balbiani ring protein 3-like isoform X5 [Photinus pyralis]|uniref:balbiani ring protein 3-like isoform X5 n=1 Tax=Photinus pyralis TaxID=7054 RepID=UPI0012676B30|nr:balbiani ring protein 3-like isoform X5 [Photinus pyralis]